MPSSRLIMSALGALLLLSGCAVDHPIVQGTDAAARCMSLVDCPAIPMCMTATSCTEQGLCIYVGCDVESERCVEGLGCTIIPECDEERCRSNLADESRCIIGQCNETGCAGVSTCIEDDNPCTTVMCGDDGCEHVMVPNGTSCAGELYCSSGADTCMGGLCILRGEHCLKECDESTDECVGCLSEVDCTAMPTEPGTPVFESECAEIGEVTDIHHSVVCDGGRCLDTGMDVTVPVTRDTERNLCGSGVRDMPGLCIEFAGMCSIDGTEHFDRLTDTCQSTVCTTDSMARTQPCTRPPPTTTGCDMPDVTFGTCGGYADSCTTDGTQTRSAVGFNCGDGTCQPQTPVVTTVSCTRPPPTTPGCASDTVVVGECTRTTTVCSRTGRESVATTPYACGAGTCNAQSVSNTFRPCSLDTDGTSCGSDGACQGGGCEDCRDEVHNNGETGVDCGGPCPMDCASCGDSNVDSGEECDDGDGGSGDGCSSTCDLESGYFCTVGPVGGPCDSAGSSSVTQLTITLGEPTGDHDLSVTASGTTSAPNDTIVAVVAGGGGGGGGCNATVTSGNFSCSLNAVAGLDQTATASVTVNGTNVMATTTFSAGPCVDQLAGASCGMSLVCSEAGLDGTCVVCIDDNATPDSGCSTATPNCNLNPPDPPVCEA